MSGLSFRPLLLALAPALLAGCGTMRPAVCSTSACPTCAGADRVVLVADGAGDYGVTSANVRRVVAEQQLPWCVEKVQWSHGKLRVYADQTDFEHARAAGHCLAQRILAHRQAQPDAKLSMIAHSAGSAVVLSAARELPPGSVEHIIVLLPSVSAEYDLRPVLRSACRGVDVFYSERDWAVLGLGTRVFGTADRRWTDAAGRVGFRPIVCSEEDARLYEKLRQHPWDRSVTWTGNHGGHYEPHVPNFLRYYVLPILND